MPMRLKLVASTQLPMQSICPSRKRKGGGAPQYIIYKTKEDYNITIIRRSNCVPTHDLNRCDFGTYISSIIFHLNNHDLKIMSVQFGYNQINQPAMQV